MIIALTYGFDDGLEKSPIAISKKMGAGSERIRQIRSDALKSFGASNNSPV